MLLHDEDEARAYVAARCSPHALASLDHLGEMLRTANATQNLVAASTLDSLWLRHIADSAQLLDHV
ncbi:MAG: 16S rRNA (guanine(527)-N(7))-methyltransferase RsmG, partial [Sphingomonadales bacterium]